MVAIPEKPNNTTLAKIDELDVTDAPREYLGMSSIGGECARHLFYTFRWAYVRVNSSRMARIFERGHLEEPRIIARLKAIGIQVYGEQLELESCSGHAKGHIDAMLLGVIEAPTTPHLGEFKTMKAAKWKECAKKGVEVAQPVYYGQAVRYMGKTHLTRTLFIAVNKDDESWYIERIKANPQYSSELAHKEKFIIMTDDPPRKVGDASWYKCKFCDSREVCHNGLPVQVNCRTCLYGEIHPEGKWHCGNPLQRKVELNYKDQLAGCDLWEKLPTL